MLRAVFMFNSGETTTVELSDGANNDPEKFLTRMSLVDEKGIPIVSIGFLLHDGGTIHTICRRLGNDIDQVEW